MNLAALRNPGQGGRRGPLRIAAWLPLALLAGPVSLQAQLVLENPHQRWAPGAVVELVLRDPDIREPDQIDAVLFDDQPIPFELVEARSASDPIRIRIRVPATVKPGAHGLSVVSSGAATGVPNVVGLTLEEARSRLEARGLELEAGAPGAGLPDTAVHTVTRQRPPAGARVRTGARIRVAIVSRIEVPETVGLGFDEAKLRLQEAGLELEAAAAPANAVVRAQDPEAGTVVPAGTRIAVEMASTIPDLVGMRIERVRTSLLERGLVPRVTLREAEDGPIETVLTQDPAAGELVTPGTAVAVTVASRPDPPAPRWPWPWLAATAALTAGLGARVRARRAVRKSYRIETHDDLDRLRETATGPAWKGLDIRLRGHPDPGRQTLDVDGPLIEEAITS